MATCARLSCILSFRVHVKLCYRIVSYYAETAEDIVTIDLFCVQQCARDALKFGLHQSTHSSPNFCPEVAHPVDLSIADIQWQIAAEWL